MSKSCTLNMSPSLCSKPKTCLVILFAQDSALTRTSFSWTVGLTISHFLADLSCATSGRGGR